MSNSKEVSIVEGKRVLHLTLKKKWFDMIASGEKKEEYREIKPFWISRLVQVLGHPHSHENFNFEWKGIMSMMDEPVPFDVVQFKNGYNKDAPTVILKIMGIDIEYGKHQWGAEIGKTYFVIKLGEILYNSNNTPQSKL